MTTKLFEVRDTHTFVPVMAVKFTEPMNNAERYLIRRTGWTYGDVTVTKLDGHQPASYGWWEQVKDYVAKEFDTLESGAVVDMRFVRGEVSEPCKSDSEF